MFAELSDMLVSPFTRDLSLKQMGLAFILFIVIAVLALDTLNILLALDTLNILKEGLQNG